MALKRGGRGHDPAGVDATSNGELTVECPACPHPGRNLPDGWENAGVFLYVSFRFFLLSFIIIHNTDSSILSSSPSMVISNSKGRNGVLKMSNSCLVGGYIVQRRSTNPISLTMLTRRRFVLLLYIAHPRLIVIGQINTCESRHDALVRASTRSTPGYAVSGAVVVICSRHCMIRRNGAGDLQLGEKYVLSDF
jgi:hypothetical protein